MSPRSIGAALLYLLCIPAANWMIGHVGACGSGPCVIPVAPGLYAPSGVAMVGLALCLRDAVQRFGGRQLAWSCVAAGALVSLAVAPPALALASAGAFAVSESLDGLVYGWSERRLGVGAIPVLLSGAVGLATDSVLFLLMAFGSLDYLAGQIVGKTWSVLGSAAIVAIVRRSTLGVGLKERHREEAEKKIQELEAKVHKAVFEEENQR